LKKIIRIPDRINWDRVVCMGWPCCSKPNIIFWMAFIWCKIFTYFLL